MIINKKYIFGLCFLSGTELLKPLEFLESLELRRFFCYVNKACFAVLEPPKNEQLAWRAKLVIRGGELSLSSWPSFWEERRVEVESIAHGQWFIQSCLCNEASVEIQKDWLQRASMLLKTCRSEESGAHGEGSTDLHAFCHTCPVPLFQLADPQFLYPFTVTPWSGKWNVSLSSWALPAY